MIPFPPFQASVVVLILGDQRIFHALKKQEKR